MKQRDFKQIKKEIQEEGPINVGFSPNALLKIMELDPDILTDVMARKFHALDLHDVAQKEGSVAFQSVLIGMMVERLKYQDFKEVAPYFFNYIKRQREIEAQALLPSKEAFEAVQMAAQEQFKEQQPSKKLQVLIDELETHQVKNEDEVIAVSPKADYAVLRHSDDTTIDFEVIRRDGLINDPYSKLSHEAQIVDHLLENGGDRLVAFFREHYFEHGDPDMRYIKEYLLDEDAKSADVLDTEDLVFFVDGEQVGEDYLYDYVDDLQGLYDFAKDHMGFEGDRDGFINSLFDNLEFDDFQDYLVEQLEDKNFVDEINAILIDDSKELITHKVIGYSQGDVWELSYLADYEFNNQDKKSEVLDYLEHTVGAWYRGSLVQLSLLDENGELDEAAAVDAEELWTDPIEKINDIFPGIDFISPEEALENEATQENSAPKL